MSDKTPKDKQTLLKDLLELNVSIVSGTAEAGKVLDPEQGNLASVADLIKAAGATAQLKLEIAGVFSVDGDLLIYKDKDVSPEDETLFFKALQAGKDYRVEVLKAIKDAADGLISFFK